ncbi:hypothetical protein AAE478_007738 [Parahypoxylon ruwenzoriense]
MSTAACMRLVGESLSDGGLREPELERLVAVASHAVREKLAICGADRLRLLATFLEVVIF